MSLKQLTIFVENKQGTLVKITDALAKNDVNIRALSIADTQDFGILRLIVTDYDKAEKTLHDAGFLAPGKLSMALDVLDKAQINMEYLYAFMSRTEKHAYVVLRVADNAHAEKALEDAGFHLIEDADVNKL